MARPIDPAKYICEWVMNFVRREPNPASILKAVVVTLNSSLSEFADRRANKVRILKLIQSLIAGGSVSEPILELLEAIEQIDRENGEETPTSEKMKAAAAYCAVAVQCTVGDGDVKFELSDRIWRVRVLKLEMSGRSHLVTDVLTGFRDAAEGALWVARDLVRFKEVATKIVAANYVRSYLDEAMAAVACSSSEQDTLPGSLAAGIPSTSLVSSPPEVQQACLDTLRSCVAKLQAVNDPLPNARQVFESLSAEAPSDVERPVGNRDERNVDVLHSSSNASVPEPSAQQGRQCFQTGQSSKTAAGSPVRHQNLLKPGLITRGLVAHPSVDASILDIPAEKDKRKEVIVISNGLESSGQLHDECFQIDQSNKAAASSSTASSTNDLSPAEVVSKSGWMTRKNTAGSSHDSSTAEAVSKSGLMTRKNTAGSTHDSLTAEAVLKSSLMTKKNTAGSTHDSLTAEAVSKSGLMTRKNTAGSTHDSSTAEAVSKSGWMTRKNTAGSSHDSSTAEAVSKSGLMTRKNTAGSTHDSLTAEAVLKSSLMTKKNTAGSTHDSLTAEAVSKSGLMTRKNTAGSTHDSLTAEAVSKSGLMTRKNTAGSTHDSSTAEAPQNISHPASVLGIPAEVGRPTPSSSQKDCHESQQADKNKAVGESSRHPNVPMVDAVCSSADGPSGRKRTRTTVAMPPPLAKKLRRKVNRWSRAEVEALEDGVRDYGTGLWKAILKSRQQVLGARNEVDLKDKWRNLHKHQ